MHSKDLTKPSKVLPIWKEGVPSKSPAPIKVDLDELSQLVVQTIKNKQLINIARGPQGPQGEQGISIAKSFYLGVSDNIICDTDSNIPLTNTINSNGVSLLINTDGSFTIKEGGVYLVLTKGYFNLIEDTEYNPELILQLCSDRQSHNIRSLEIDSDYVNTISDFTLIDIKNDETFQLKNISNKVIFKGDTYPLRLSLIKLS